jgi:hypothetical protein
MKMTVFWGVAPCSPSEIDRRALMMVTVSTSETLVNFCETTRRSIPEDSYLQVHKIFQSNIIKFLLPIILFSLESWVFYFEGRAQIEGL